MKGYARDRNDDTIQPFLSLEKRYDNDYYNFDDSPIYTTEGLKTKLRHSPLERILHYQYKYSSADGKYYILAVHFSEDREGRINITHYSKYLYDNNELVDGQRGHNKVMPTKIFTEIILMENWDEHGEEQVIAR